MSEFSGEFVMLIGELVKLVSNLLFKSGLLSPLIILLPAVSITALLFRIGVFHSGSRY